MLGHDGSFGYIKAVELAASSSIIHKRTGYLLCACCLPPSHEFRFMLVNQMQRDLQSSSILDICASLIAVTSIITSDMVPAMQALVLKMMDHPSELVRKKAIIALHRFHQLAPEAVEKQDLVILLRKVLCDRDPSVMGASLNVIEPLATIDPKPFKDLVPSLISILKQVIEHRLPSDFEYHRVPAPWIQMKIVRILAVLGKNDANASNGMYQILGDCMKKADVGINAGYAVVYECIRTITSIYPNSTLLDAAADAISRFIQSKSQNLKYFGVTGLASIVEAHPQYAAQHQMSVIECLEDRDETLQRRTLDLLYRMTSPVNVQFITERLLQFLRGSTDAFLQQDLTSKICNLAERYAPSNLWYIDTVTELFEISGDFVKQEVAQNLMTLIAEGAGDGDEGDGDDADTILRQHAIVLYVNMLDKPFTKLPKLLLETMAWVLGEYAYLSQDYSLEEILNKLCTLIRTGKQLEPTTRKIMVSAIMKLISQAGTCPPQAAKIIDDFTRSKDIDLQQRCLEFQNLITKAPIILAEVLPVDASCEDLQVDPDLSFLNGYVNNALNEGARPYENPTEDDDDEEDVYRASTAKSSVFKLTPYEKPTKPSASYKASSTMGGVGSGMKSSSAGITPPPGSYGHGQSTTIHTDSGARIESTNEPQLNVRNVTNKWGKGGISSSGTSSAPPPVTAPLPAAPPPPISNTWSSSYNNRSSIQTHIQAPDPPIKTEEQIRKEKMAAALFGGSIPNAEPATRSMASRRPTQRQPTSIPSRTPDVPPPPVEMDLLDFMSEPSPIISSDIPDVDVLAPMPVSDPIPVVETTTVPSAAEENLDPFAASGLLDGFSDKELTSLSSDSTFQFNGQSLAPLKITTPQFGQKWGTIPHQSPISTTSHQCTTIHAFMDLCQTVGAHKVDTITATSEGICAGMLGGSQVILIHGKVSPGSRIDVTIKSTDATLGGCFAMYMQNMIR